MELALVLVFRVESRIGVGAHKVASRGCRLEQGHVIDVDTCCLRGIKDVRHVYEDGDVLTHEFLLYLFSTRSVARAPSESATLWSERLSTGPSATSWSRAFAQAECSSAGRLRRSPWPPSATALPAPRGQRPRVQHSLCFAPGASTLAEAHQPRHRARVRARSPACQPRPQDRRQRPKA